ncbi:hypothetical protein LCGC14_1445340 [marine sediment metagenome]|uniref:Uncharacterized protein n=1 Tax=marine sediment metagenome TaxID=412755 RepID=A0A0F9JJE5_9ZZZZ
MNELSYEAAITLKIPGTDYGMAKPSVRFTIDVEGDIDAQIEQHKKALEKLAPAVEESLAQELANITGLNVEGYGVAAKVEKLEKLLDFTVKEMKRQKEIIESEAKKTKGGKRKKVD